MQLSENRRDSEHTQGCQFLRFLLGKQLQGMFGVNEA